MTHQSILTLMLLTASQAAFAAGNQGYPTIKEIEATYSDDRQLCAEEDDSGARMQCLRDAKSEYSKAMALATQGQTGDGTTYANEAECMDCGKVIQVSVTEKKGEGSALGIIGGGVAGALLGSLVGNGKGKTLATVAGAAGGAFAGNKVEENAKTINVWSVRVRFNDGQEQAYLFNQPPQLVVGDVVEKSGVSIARR